jgi:protein-S-isoprenylcysteine O-methyltransferase Ste14
MEPAVPKPSKPGVYDFYDRTLAQRIVLAILVAASVILADWILLGSGLETIGEWFGRTWHHGNNLRCIALATALTLYFLRLLLTSFVFMKRGMRWSEAFAIAPWLLCIFLLLAIYGGLNAAPFAVAAWAGVALFLIGSWMNTWAEHQRNTWKRRPENRGHLYTDGLFRYTRHPNYFGDVLLFSGLCLICGRWVTALIPALMFIGFAFANIPILDRHLREHYGDEFTRHAAHTRKLIPFIY